MVLVVMVQLIIGGNVFDRLLIMMFCGVECFSYIVQMMVQKKMVKVSRLVVSQLVVRFNKMMENLFRVNLRLSVFLGWIWLDGIGWLMVCFMIWLMFVFYYMFRVVDVLVLIVMYKILIKVINGCVGIGVMISLISVVNMISDIMCGFNRVQQFFNLVLCVCCCMFVLVIDIFGMGIMFLFSYMIVEVICFGYFYLLGGLFGLVIKLGIFFLQLLVICYRCFGL